MTNERAYFKWCVAISLALAGCDVGMGETCAAYACINNAETVGSFEVPDTVKVVDTEYCSEAGCVEGSVDLSELGAEAACIREYYSPWEDGICFTRADDGTLQLSANLTRNDTGTLPPDGERYTVRVVDHDSGQVLLEQTREADYEVTRQDNCHLCWNAQMTL
jgi:hypothetical protein